MTSTETPGFFSRSQDTSSQCGAKKNARGKCPRAHGYFPPRFLASLSKEKIEVTRSPLARSLTQTSGVIRVGSLREVNGCH